MNPSDPAYKEVARCQRPKHRLPPYTLSDAMKLPVYILKGTEDTVINNVALHNLRFMAERLDQLLTDKVEPPHIFWHDKFSRRESLGQTYAAAKYPDFSYPPGHLPWRLSWWYGIPSNSGKGRYLICFDYPDLVNLINDGV